MTCIIIPHTQLVLTLVLCINPYLNYTIEKTILASLMATHFELIPVFYSFDSLHSSGKTKNYYKSMECVCGNVHI